MATLTSAVATPRWTGSASSPGRPDARFAALLKDGRTVEGSAETVVSYQVPIFGRQWSGNVVRAEVTGHAMIGMINDWKPKEQPYGLS